MSPYTGGAHRHVPHEPQARTSDTAWRPVCLFARCRKEPVDTAFREVRADSIDLGTSRPKGQATDRGGRSRNLDGALVEVVGKDEIRSVEAGLARQTLR